MRERITRGMLDRKVDYLKEIGKHVKLDRHQPGGNRYIWAVEDMAGHRLWNGRMTARECLIFLAGMAITDELPAERTKANV